MKYNITYEDGNATSVTAFHKGEQYVANADHPNFDAILHALAEGKRSHHVIGLFDSGTAIERGFRNIKKFFTKPTDDTLVSITDKVEIKNGAVYFDGDRLDGAITETILRFHTEGNENFLPLARFLERLQANPNRHSREHLYEWLRRTKFAITEDGTFLAYKGVNSDYGSKHNTGWAMVNGKKVSGSVPNKPGNIITLPRDKVMFDPNQHCAFGLHAGSWSYASTFASRVVRVEIDPADVVSVPNDHGYAKMRVCKYKVLEDATKESQSAYYMMEGTK